MKSKTKNLITEDEIKHLVKVNFGSSCEVGGIEELKGGIIKYIEFIFFQQHFRQSGFLICKFTILRLQIM